MSITIFIISAVLAFQTNMFLHVFIFESYLIAHGLTNLLKLNVYSTALFIIITLVIGKGVNML